MTTVLKTRFGDVHVHKEIIHGDCDNIPTIDLAPMGSPDLDERKELAAPIYDACSRVDSSISRCHFLTSFPQKKPTDC